MRKIVLLCALALSGCSWVFQSHLQDHHRANAEPVCSTGHGWMAADLVFAALNVGGAISASNSSDPNASTYVAAGIIWGLVHVTSALTGAHWASECSEAISEYERSDQQDDDRAANQARTYEQQHRAELETRQAPPAPPPPRGFYCAGDFCEREREDCERVHEVAVANNPDAPGCALTEAAWCFGTQRARCFTRAELCGQQRDAAVASGSVVGDCEERR